MKSKIVFLKEFFKNPSKTGSLIPSSKYLAKQMIDSINFSKNIIIVEYGPGEGVFSNEIIKRKNKESIIILIELNKIFYNQLKNKFKDIDNVFIFNDSVENVENILKNLNINNIDYIISGIPFSSLPKELTKIILKNTKRIMNNKSSFITFQYSKIKFKLFFNYFKSIKIIKVWKNFPPAYVLNCKI